MSILSLLFWPKSELFFLKSQFYRYTDLHATYKLAPAGTRFARFAQSPLRGLAISCTETHSKKFVIKIFTKENL